MQESHTVKAGAALQAHACVALASKRRSGCSASAGLHGHPSSAFSYCILFKLGDMLESLMR
jgi:hypothetical protein